MSVQYANELEHWFYSLPQLVQETLHEPFDWINGVLKDISGDPEDLIAAGMQYTALGNAVRAAGQQQLGDRRVLDMHWRGQAHDAFDRRMESFESRLDKLGSAIAHTNDVLSTGAKAAVDGANMIIDIVKGLIMFALGQIAVNVALSVVTLGTSLAAGVAEVMLKAAEALSKVMKVVEKLAQVMNKIVRILNKITRLLKDITDVLRDIKKLLRAMKDYARGVNGFKAKILAQMAKGTANAIVTKTIDVGTFGVVDPPGAVGSAIQAGSDYVDGWKDASETQKAAAPDSNP